MIRILFVGQRDICRSPAARAVFEDLLIPRNIADMMAVDSAGAEAEGESIGEPPCSIVQQAARFRGVEMSHLRARQVQPEDFADFDYIYAMDRANYRALLEMAPPGQGSKMTLFLSYAPNLSSVDAPDPRQGGLKQAEEMLDIIEDAALALLEHLLKTEICP